MKTIRATASKEALIKELKKFTKQGLNLEELDNTAEQLRYTREIVLILDKEFSKPSDELISFFARQVSSKKLTQQVKDKFGLITKDALNQFLVDKINSRLKIAMDASKTQESETAPVIVTPEGDGIVTTPEEWEAFYITKAILSEIIEPNRVCIRDAKTYCAVLLDDNNRKSICRFYFNTKQYYFAVFDNEKKTENKIPISNLNEIFKLASHLKNVVIMYDSEKKNNPISATPS